MSNHTMWPQQYNYPKKHTTHMMGMLKVQEKHTHAVNIESRGRQGLSPNKWAYEIWSRVWLWMTADGFLDIEHDISFLLAINHQVNKDSIQKLDIYFIDKETFLSHMVMIPKEILVSVTSIFLSIEDC